MKNSWNSINTFDIVLPDIPSFYISEKDEILSFIYKLLEPEDVKKLSRCDYREFLELAKVILGEIVERKNGYTYTIQRPGADHHARWMSKAIYIIKMNLLLHQLHDIHYQTKKKIQKMSIFVVFVYLRPWFSAASLTSAAMSMNDNNLYNDIQKFRKVHSKVSTATSSVTKRHTWYLKEELIPFSLFNESLPEEIRSALAAKIGQLHQL